MTRICKAVAPPAVGRGDGVDRAGGNAVAGEIRQGRAEQLQPFAQRRRVLQPRQDERRQHLTDVSEDLAALVRGSRNMQAPVGFAPAFGHDRLEARLGEIGGPPLGGKVGKRLVGVVGVELRRLKQGQAQLGPVIGGERLQQPLGQEQGPVAQLFDDQGLTRQERIPLRPRLPRHWPSRPPARVRVVGSSLSPCPTPSAGRHSAFPP